MNNSLSTTPGPATPGLAVVLSLSLVAAAAGAFGGWMLSNSQLEPRIQILEQKMKSVPQVAIADFGKVAMTFPDDISDEQVDSIISAYNNSVKKLQDAGFVVINGQSVSRAPEEFYIPDPRSIEKADTETATN